MNITIIGLGLIGGSIAAACKQAGVKQITAYDKESSVLEYALHTALIDNHEKTIPEAIKDADIIIIAVPPGQCVAVLQQIQLVVNDRQLITDTLSIKDFVNKAARQILGKHASQFVASHPITGSEKSGIKHATADLFINSWVALTPSEETKPDVVQQIKSFWQLIGANTFLLDPIKHDELLATTSHLPHVLSFAFSKMFMSSNNKDEAALCCFGSFNDVTRIATSDPALWADICIHNRDAILATIDNFEQNLGSIKLALQNNDKKTLFDMFAQATAIKEWRKK